MAGPPEKLGAGHCRAARRQTVHSYAARSNTTMMLDYRAGNSIRPDLAASAPGQRGSAMQQERVSQ
jgi:hypothetical protein